MESLYQSLEHPDSIRLLKFARKPNTSKDSLHCFSLITIRLSDPNRPSYQALSYTWGENTDQRTILINGIEVRIRLNLWTFINRALPSSQLGISYLWVDVLCISQTDLQEKASQVQRIGDTFRAARRVLAWLGGEEQQPWSNLDPESKHLDESFEGACNAPFWKRTWIIQEILVAPQLLICFDKHIFIFEQFYDLWRHNARILLRRHNSDYAIRMCAFMLGQRAQLSRRVVGDTHKPQLLTDSGPQLDILSLVSMFSHSTCAVALDKVYALLSLVDWRGHPPLQVDYELHEEALYFRTLSSSKEVEFFTAENLRGALQISVDRIMTSSLNLLQNQSISELEIHAGFENPADTRIDDHWDLSQLPILYDGPRSSSYYLHSGSVQAGDLLLESSGTQIYLVLRKTGTTGKFTVKGIALAFSSEVWLPVMLCPDDCVDNFTDVEWYFEDLLEPTKKLEKVYLTIKARAWFSLCWHCWEMKRRQLSDRSPVHQSKLKKRLTSAQTRIVSTFQALKARLGGAPYDYVYNSPQKSRGPSPTTAYEMTSAINELGEARTGSVVNEHTEPHDHRARLSPVEECENEYNVVDS